MKRPGASHLLCLGILGMLAHTVWAAPADRLPDPRPEMCVPFDADPADGEMATPEGLAYGDVRAALNGVIQTALYCGQPDGFSEVHLTFELSVGCDGVVSDIETIEDDEAPEEYVSCISAVISKADFPAHDIEGGMPVTYPVNVAW